MLQQIRGSLLSGCHIALTGVAQVDEETLDHHPLVALVRLYGAQLTLSVDSATHLVARKKDGWHNSSKIRKALARSQVQHHVPPPRTMRSPSSGALDSIGGGFLVSSERSASALLAFSS